MPKYWPTNAIEAHKQLMTMLAEEAAWQAQEYGVGPVQHWELPEPKRKRSIIEVAPRDAGVPSNNLKRKACRMCGQIVLMDKDCKRRAKCFQCMNSTERLKLYEQPH